MFVSNVIAVCYSSRMPLDIGVGLFLGIFLNNITALNYGLCLALGVVACLLPDLDFIWPLFKIKRAPGSEHRDGLHYPLLEVPAVGIIGWIIMPEIGQIFALGSLLHFLHDSIGVGFGIKWLYPFKKNSYLFIYHAGLPTNKDMPRKKLHSWNNAERKAVSQKFGDPDWIRNIYFRPHPYGIFEYAVLIAGLVAATAHI